MMIQWVKVAMGAELTAAARGLLTAQLSGRQWAWSATRRRVLRLLFETATVQVLRLCSSNLLNTLCSM